MGCQRLPECRRHPLLNHLHEHRLDLVLLGDIRSARVRLGVAAVTVGVSLQRSRFFSLRLVTINRIVKWIYLTFRVVPAMTETRSEGLSAIFAALSDPTRRVILERLSRGAATPGELARPLRILWPAVTKHLRVLERAGLLQRRRSGRRHILTLEAGPIRHADEWIASYRRFWEGSLDALADYLERGVSKSERPAAPRSKDRQGNR